jgi:hypothetical protein
MTVLVRGVERRFLQLMSVVASPIVPQVFGETPEEKLLP